MAKSAEFQTVRVGRRPEAAPLYGAAYLLTETAYVVLDEDRGEVVLRLRAKPGRKLASGQELQKMFDRVYADQRHRWALEHLSSGVRVEIAQRMVRLADHAHAPGEAGAPVRLPDEAEREITAALEEGPVRDALAIRTIFEKARKR